MDFVIVDQFVDRTNHAREMSFFEPGIVVHIGFAHPVCTHLTHALFYRMRSLKIAGAS